MTDHPLDDPLEGTWSPEWSIWEGRPTADEDLRDVTLKYEGGICTVLRKDTLIRVGTYVVGVNRFPRTIDVCFSESDVVELTDTLIKGIFERDGENLRVCIGPPGGERPRSFSAEKGTGNYLGCYRLVADVAESSNSSN